MQGILHAVWDVNAIVGSMQTIMLVKKVAPSASPRLLVAAARTVATSAPRGDKTSAAVKERPSPRLAATRRAS